MGCASSRPPRSGEAGDELREPQPALGGKAATTRARRLSYSVEARAVRPMTLLRGADGSAELRQVSAGGGSKGGDGGGGARARDLSCVTAGSAAPSERVGAAGEAGAAPGAARPVEVAVACVSVAGREPGYRKTNQDNCFAYERFVTHQQALFCALDGHGPHGHLVSGFVKQHLPGLLVAALTSGGQDVPGALRSSFLDVDAALARSAVDCEFSGSTCSLVHMQGSKLVCAWVGDSRVVLGRQEGRGRGWAAADLSADHKPTLPEEAARIAASHGRVERLVDEEGQPMGPHRVWLQAAWIPGLAMSRALGDQLAHTVGVSSEPQVAEVSLTPADRLLILASDGVWELMSSQEAVELVGSTDTPEDGARLRVLLAGAGGAALPGVDPASVPSGLFCYTQDVSYSHRVDNPGQYNWCIVPSSSYDVTLFGGVAVVLACLLQGKLNTLMVLVAGAVLMAVAWPVNLGALGNSIAIWLGIAPWQLFFYVFLPPLLLDAAVRIDWFMFRKSFIQVFTLAFLVVGATCAACVPIMLYMLDLRKYGWNWLHACMFGAMVASTDAVAIVSIMKTAGGPKRLRVMLEGESLLNDASGLTLFEVFFHLMQVQMSHPEATGPIGETIGHVFLAVFQLATIGFVMGMAFGVATRLFLRFMRHMGAGHDQEVALTLGMAYLAYWITAVPCKGSGVVAVAVLGLYGAATNWWDMSTAAHHTFDGFWETTAFVVNSLVFLYSGASVVNFFIRASNDLLSLKLHRGDLATTLWMVPIIYAILMLLRFGLTAAFRPLFIAIRGDMSFSECIFITVAGLRGSASLIMGSAVVTYQTSGTKGAPEFSVVKAMMVFWTAGFVLLTLLINAPLLPTVLRLTGLSDVPPKQLARRRRAVAALGDHTAAVLEQLRDAEDELLAGVDWAQVAAFVDHGRRYGAFTGQAKPHKPSRLARVALRLWAAVCGCCGRGPPGGAPPAAEKGGRSEHGRGSRSRHGGGGGPGSPDGGGHRSRHGSGGLSRAATGDKAGEPGELGGGADLEHGNGVLRGGSAGPACGSATSAGRAAQRKSSRLSARRASQRASREEGRRPTDSHAGGTVSDDEGSSSDASGRSASSTSSSTSTATSSSSGSGGLLNSVLPMFGGVFGNEVDVLHQECPFLGSSSAKPARTPAGPAAEAGGHADQAAAGGGGGGGAASGSGSGVLSRFWAQRARQAPLPVASGGGGAGAPAAGPPPPGGEPLPPLRLPSAFAAATASRSAAADALSRHSGSRGGAPGGSPSAHSSKSASALGGRGLATRSAAPAFVYADRAPLPPPPGGAGAGAAPRAGGWGLAGSVSAGGLAAGGGGAEAERPAGSPRAGVRPALPLQTDKALGRTSGMYRGLATRSVGLGGLGAAGGSAGDLAGAGRGALPPHLPEGEEAAMGCPGGGGFDPAAAAVDMVSLARCSRRGGGGGSDATCDDVLARPAPAARSLACRSAGLAGAYASRGSLDGDAPGLPARGAAGLARQGSGTHGASAGGGPGAGAAAPRGLATRSVNPHLPPVAPVAPSLYTISTGLGAAYGASARRGAPAGDAPPRGLAAHSVPLEHGAHDARDAAPAGEGPPRGLLAALRKSVARVSKLSLGSGRGGGEGSDDERPRGLDKSSTGLASDAKCGEELADARSWLLSGLKRYFHSKRMEGLLSARGLRILDAACEAALEDPSRPLMLWCNISRDAANNLVVRCITYSLFLCRQASVSLGTLGAVGRLLSWPLRALASMLQRPLNKEGEAWSALLGEVQDETGRVAQFLIDREVEAPERYSAVQSYRVASAVLRQQRLFVDVRRAARGARRTRRPAGAARAARARRRARPHPPRPGRPPQSLFESGMLDGGEVSTLAHPIEAAERRLELMGPVWRAPGVGEVLRSLPFMRGQAPAVLDFLLKHGHLVMFGAGEALPVGRDFFVVQSGIIKVTYQPDLGPAQEYFLGAGGVFSLYAALTGEALPGTTAAVAQGNALGKGPVLFCFGAKGLRKLSALAAGGDAAFQQLELDMWRLAGLFLLERLRPAVDLEVSQALARLAPSSTAHGDRSGARGKRVSKAARAAWVRAHLAALRCDLKAQVVSAELLLLPRGCSVAQEGHAMLLQGSAQVKVVDPAVLADPGASEVARWMTSAGRHQHNSVLPWLWEVLGADDLAHAPAALRRPLAVTITAGPEGATLLVCPPAGAEEGAPVQLAQRAASVGRRAGPGGPRGGGEPNPLSRRSGGEAPGAHHHPFTRRSLAAAAAAERVMEPLPGGPPPPPRPLERISAGSAGGGASLTPATSVTTPGAPAAPGAAAPGAATLRELGRRSPLQLRSSLPLAGAPIDNAALVGGMQGDGGSGAAAALSALDEAGGGSEAPRRNRSRRPLKGGGERAGERRGGA
ncbi:NHX8 [Scenedesmus sp. PABB004]|nr:NHX8 [Scenedesmus sp. PABB004]